MLLPRPELTEKILQSAASCNLTAVVAPMGYGKTTLARAVAEKLPHVYYYAVPAGPHDGHFVWHDMCAAFEAQGLGIAPALWRLGMPESASQARQALDFLRDLGTEAAPHCLILDDYHYASDPLLDAFWERTARESIPHLHLVLLSRTIPNVNLEELCLKGYAAQFEQDLLTFSQNETNAFFQASGIEDPTAAIESQHYSEGWPAVLWLCLQSWHKIGRIIASGNIDSLLANAVFAAYSPEEQNLLLRLSVFESFQEEDAEKITAGSDWLPASLMELRQKNAFLSFDAKTTFYQFHSLFREFLRKRLAVTAHIDKPSLYRLAGECCFTRHDYDSAFRFFHQAGRDEDLFRLLDTFQRLVDNRSPFYFAEERFHAANAIPWRVRLQNPLGWLAFIYLYTLMWRTDYRIITLLNEAEESFRTANVIPPYMKNRLQGELEVIRGNLLFNNLRATTCHYSRAASLLNGPSIFGSKSGVWNYRSPSLTFIALREPGEYEEMLKQHSMLLREYNILSDGKLQYADTILLAEFMLEQGKVNDAISLFKDSLNTYSDSPRLLMTTLIGTFGLARAFIASGIAEKTLSQIEYVCSRIKALDLAELFDSADIALGYVAAVLGRLDAIPSWLRNGDIFDPPHDVLPHVFGISLTVYGKSLLLQEEYQRLAAIAEKIPDAASFVSLFARIHSKILQALSFWHTKGQKEALESLREALSLSCPDNLALILAEYGGHILPLLRRFKRENPHEPFLDAALGLTERIAHITASRGKPQKKLLTPREQEIMRHVVNGETNPAIAASLHISINTVKYLLAKACAKLGAEGRLEAAQHFVELYTKTQA